MSITRVLVDDDIFNNISNEIYEPIPYLNLDGNSDITKFDFVIIKNRNGDELLRHFLSWENNALKFTAPFYTYKMHNDSCSILTNGKEYLK